MASYPCLPAKAQHPACWAEVYSKQVRHQDLGDSSVTYTHVLTHDASFPAWQSPILYFSSTSAEEFAATLSGDCQSSPTKQVLFLPFYRCGH